MTVDRIAASGEMLGAMMVLGLLAICLRNRSYIREITTDQDRIWRIIPRLAAATLVVFIGWASIFDNWRQLTGMPFRAIKQFPSERVQIDPPSATLRTITLILLAITLVLFGALVARHVGGYFLQLTIVAGALAAWLPCFVIRQRFSLNMALGFDGNWHSPADVGGYVAFDAITYLFDIGLIAICFIALLGLVALPVTLVLDLTRTRHPRITTEAKPFFSSIGTRASDIRQSMTIDGASVQNGDRPLQNMWGVHS